MFAVEIILDRQKIQKATLSHIKPIKYKFSMFEKTGKTPHLQLIYTTLALLLFGWMMVLSTSVHMGFSHFQKQGIFIVLGLIGGFIMLKLPLSFLKKYAPLFYILGTFLLALVFVPGLGVSAKGATRWIDLGLFNFQPSEMMKLVVILFIAGYIVSHEKDVGRPWLGIFKTGAVLSVPILLILFETDMGATLLIVATVLAMLLVAGGYFKQLAIISAGSVSLMVLALYLFPESARAKRLFEFWQTELWANTSEKVIQTKQALIGIARGDWTGTGVGAGIQKYSRLPESHNDMIFAIIGEELGVIGMLFVLLCFGYIIGKGFNIAKEALKHGKKYSSFVAFGISIWLALQSGVNIAMNLGLIPIKGFTLPFISYGGSSMIFAIVSIAILLRIDMENRVSFNKQKNYV